MVKPIGLIFFMAFCIGFLTGFDTGNAIVPQEEILSGGPPKDGIPALLEPKFIPAAQADFLKDDDQVYGVAVGNKARAYPVNILNWHEAVNDTLGDQPIVVTF